MLVNFPVIRILKEGTSIEEFVRYSWTLKTTPSKITLDTCLSILETNIESSWKIKIPAKVNICFQEKNAFFENAANFHGNPINSINVEEVKMAPTVLLIVVFFNLSWIQVLTIDFVDNIFQGWIFPSDVYISYTPFFFSLSAALSESFSLRRGEQEFSCELFEVAALHVLPISSCRGTVGLVWKGGCYGHGTTAIALCTVKCELKVLLVTVVSNM